MTTTHPLQPTGGDSLQDRERMIALARAFPERNIHLIDLPYRLCSPAMAAASNRCLWEDIAGELAAWAVWQPPFSTLDYACHPDREAEASDLVFAWARERLAHPAGEQNVTICWVMARDRDVERIAALERNGFNKHGWYHTRMQRPLNEILFKPDLPVGFSVRPLAGEEEVEAYVALHRAAFGSRNMTVEWRRRILECPEYVPELDLIAVSPDGRLAGFCINWLMTDVHGKRQAQIEPMGVHPEWQRMGLGRALLLESLRRMRAHGAETACVSAGYNDAAQQVYLSVGFEPADREYAYGKEFQSRIDAANRKPLSNAGQFILSDYRVS